MDPLPAAAVADRQHTPAWLDAGYALETLKQGEWLFLVEAVE